MMSSSDTLLVPRLQRGHAGFAHVAEINHPIIG
jgi:hypothetical protein